MWPNLYVFNDLTIAYFVSYVFAVRYNDRYGLFHDRHKFIGAGHFDRQVPQNYFQACKTRMLRIHTLFACESGLSEPKIGLKHAFVLLIWQKKQDK
jgi:hypothetical protein